MKRYTLWMVAHQFGYGCKISFFVKLLPLLVLGQALGASGQAFAADVLPNVVIIFTDDQGYADVGCFGAKGFNTPNLDKMAQEGRKFTNFHVAQPVCSASRAALLTGCYPNRIGIHGAFGPGAKQGLAASETTLAELFKQKNFATGMAGKWHLGDRPQFLPTRHGFDEYLGLPYSNDMWPNHPDRKREPGEKPPYPPPLPLIEGERVIDDEVTAHDQKLLTRQYTERAVSFIERNKDRPFFFYLAHSMPHVPLFGDEKFHDKAHGKTRFGQIIEEIDWSVGEVLKAIDDSGLSEKTLVIFTSDNGPWLSYGDHAGSSGPLREGKGTCWEGGVRVPCIMRWPGHIASGTTCETMLMTIDLFPTLAKLIDVMLPPLPIDGLDVGSIVFGPEPNLVKNPHDFYYFYYETNQLQAVCTGDGRWKLQLPHTYRTLGGRRGGRYGKPVPYYENKITKPELYDLTTDLGETNNVAANYPDIEKSLVRAAARARTDMGDSLVKCQGTGVRPAGQAE